MQLQRYYFLLILFAGSLFSCKTDESLYPLHTPEEYFPLQTGKYITWSVDSIIYHETFANDTSSTQVMEMLTDTFYDNEQRLNYKIERYSRVSDTSDWILQHVWSVLFTDGQIQKVENDLRFIKLVTPATNNTQWAGNSYLGGLEDLPFDEECNRLTYLENWEYTYANAEEPYTVNGFDFDKTIKVMQAGDSNFIWYNYAEEIYAAGVGMVQKDFYHYYTQDTGCPGCPWEERAQCGYSVKMRIIDHN